MRDIVRENPRAKAEFVDRGIVLEGMPGDAGLLAGSVDNVEQSDDQMSDSEWLDMIAAQVGADAGVNVAFRSLVPGSIGAREDEYCLMLKNSFHLVATVPSQLVEGRDRAAVAKILAPILSRGSEQLQRWDAEGM